MKRIVFVFLCAVFATACGSGHADAPENSVATAAAPPAATTAPAPVGDRTAALAIFAARCAPCHGAQGLADTPVAAGLDPKPRNFHDKAWQASVTDDHIEKIIREGGPAVGKSPVMPSNKDLVDQPQVVVGLRGIVRDFGAQ